MSFEKLLDADILRTDFGGSRYLKSFKERPHISKVRLDGVSGCKYLGVGEYYESAYDARLGTRYVAAPDMDYDMLLTIYDANTWYIMVYRLFQFGPAVAKRMEDRIKGMREANWEARIVGLQSKQEYGPLREAVSFIRKNGMRLFEVDLFGSDTRNIAVDTRIGVPFDILMGDKPYKPGELASKQTLEQFMKANNINGPLPVMSMANPMAGAIAPKPKAEKGKGGGLFGGLGKGRKAK